MSPRSGTHQSLRIPVCGVVLAADVGIPETARGAVLFAHGCGSGRHRRSRSTCGPRRCGSTSTCSPVDPVGLADGVDRSEPTAGLGIGLFGASTGAAAALMAAASRPTTVQAVVSRGGRADLAGGHLHEVRQPTLLIVGERDSLVIDLNRQAMRELAGETSMAIVPGASHLFEERGALEQVAHMARDWFHGHLQQLRRDGHEG
ncbi:MAG: dienelactone hydrolase [Frankiales bacterium]|nr:dienelactone hydrolase [Frankiales bacterium]